MPTTLIEGARRDRRRVVIAGGGVAALETLLALTEIAPDHVAVQLVAPQRELTYRPLSVAEPFRLAEPQRVDLARVAADRGAQFQLGTVKAVAAGSVRTEARERIPWDALMLAVGTQPTPALTGALSFGGNEDVAAFRALLDDLAAGRASKLAFVVPRGVGWTLPLYELALMTAARCAGLGIDAELHLATVERRPLELFGLAVSDHVATLLDDAGIALRTAVEPLAVHSGRLILAPYGSIAVTARWRCRAGASRISPASRADRRASSLSTTCVACRGATASTPPATQRGIRSSKAASRRSRPTPRRRQSRPPLEPRLSRSHSSQSCAVSC
jgi:hypothetical protein